MTKALELMLVSTCIISDLIISSNLHIVRCQHNRETIVNPEQHQIIYKFPKKINNQSLINANYILLDAARMGLEIVKALQLNQGSECLYQGINREALASAAPYLFPYKEGTEFANWIREEGCGKSWGVFIKSHVPFEELIRHCRKFILVNTEEEKELYFRYYDPRVLRIFLPTCSSEQLKEFFGPINYFVFEDQDPSFEVKYWLENYKLKTARFSLNGGDGEGVPVGETSPPETDITKKRFAFGINREEPTTSKEERDPNTRKGNAAPKPEKAPEKRPKDPKWNEFFFD